MKSKKLSIKRIVFLCILSLTLIATIGVYASTNKTTKSTQAATIVAYSQTGESWSNLYYGGRTIGVTGCGILSLTNAINYYRPMSYNNVYTCITEIASHAYSKGDFNGTYGGTMVAYFTKFAGSAPATKYKVTGGTTTYWDNAYNTTLINHLKKDNTFAVANVYGHYVALVDYDETKYDSYNGEYGKFLLLDSYQMVGGTAGGYTKWIGTPGGYNWASRHQLSYLNDLSYWYNLGYSSSTYYAGKQNANVVSNFHLFTIEPIVEESALPVTSNKILGDAGSLKAATTWEVSKTYTPSSIAYTSRMAKLTSFSGENNLYFNQTDSNHVKVGATFKTISKASTELYGKFGIGFYTKAGKGLFTYIDAEGTSGTDVSTITGTNVAVVGKNTSGAEGWTWKTSTNYNNAENVYTSSSPIRLEIERDGVRFDVYINGTYYGTINGLNYDIDPDEEIYPCITSFNVGLEVTDYYSIATHNGISLDGKLDDWKGLKNWNEIESNKKEIYDSVKTTKGATFYYRWTNEGLFIYAIAHHENDQREQTDWYRNTNFEIMINKDSSSSQYYAIYNQVRGFDSFYFATSGSSGNYTSVLEAFIADCTLFKDGINLGFQFRVNDYTNKVYDYITPAGGSQTPKWWAENKDPMSFPFAATKEFMREEYENYEMAGKVEGDVATIYTIPGISKDGKTMVLDGFTGVRDFYFQEFEDSFHNSLKATFNVTGKADSATNAKIGLSYLDDWGDGFYFYADTLNVGTFAIVRIYRYEYKYGETDTAKTFTNATWSMNTPFTLQIDRNNTIFDLYVNGTKIHTISDSTVYKLQNKQSVLPSIRSWNTYAKIDDYGMVLDPISDIVIDANLEDWKALSNWETIQNNVISVVDDNNPNKGYWLYSRLVEDGLLVAVEAKHAKDLSGNWGENWWKNTCMQFYIGESSYSNRIYVSEFLNTGFTYANFATSGTSGNYTTIFEGFIDTQTLNHLYGLTSDSIRIGLGFRVNDGTTTDTITVDGKTQTFWYADGAHPLLINNVVSLEGTTHTHEFNKQVKTNKYLVTNTPCGENVKYYYSCECGAKGTTTFETTDVVEHSFNKQVISSDYLDSIATCKKKATYYYSCECGAKGTETFETGELTHNYGTFINEIPAQVGVAGTKGHYTCSTCNKHFDIDKTEILDLEIPALTEPVSSSSSSQSVTPSSSSKVESSSQSINSSSSTNSSSKVESSSTQENSSNNDNSSSEINNNSSSGITPTKGCKSSLNPIIYLIPFAIIAVAILLRKKRN
ncbi:MAG: hypothetical protein J6C97_05375 [Clostridia bacterium]|nr:hypothetical protein [Clostridia bacterium]